MKNKTLYTDFYQLSMMQSYVKNGLHNQEVVMDMFFRKNPHGGGYCIICGVNELIEFIQNISFNDEDIAYFKSLGKFDDEFIDILKDFSFTGDIASVQEGTIMFAHEPIVRVRANILQALYIETALLSIINFQSLIATKASRVCMSAGDDMVLEFGSRRAQGLEAGTLGAKAAVIGGCFGTSNVLAGKKFDIKISGTHSHAWVQSFDSELEAFRAYAKAYPDETILLVDTYDTLRSGIPNAIKVFKELRQSGHEPKGIRIDSGDLEYLSKKARKMLDRAGFEDVKIVASDNLDEYTIEYLKSLGAKIDVWGVGTKLITSYDYPSLGGVYKLAAMVKNETFEPKMKMSEDPRKMNNPGFKQVFRLHDKETSKALADIIALESESIDENKDLEIFHPLYTYKRKTLKNFYVKALLEPLFEKGKLVGKICTTDEAKKRVKEQKELFWHEYLRNMKPATYKVDLSEKLHKIRQDLIDKNRVKK